MAKPLWQSLVVEPEERVLPWLGGCAVHWRERSWHIAGELPPEHGWYRFRLTGRKADVVDVDTMPLDFELGQRLFTGYLLGDRLISDRAQVRPDAAYLDGLVRATRRVRLVERGLGRFARATAIEDKDRELIFVREDLPLGPELDVEHAWQDGLTSVDHIKDVLPSLDLAFRWLVRERERAEEMRARLAREAEEAARRAEEERMMAELRDRVARQVDDGAGRRELARVDMRAAVTAALALSGARLLDVREARGRNELVVNYRFRGQRLECVVDARTLRVVDAGVCLVDHETHERGDMYFTLESLPAVIGQAMDEDRLVIWRHHD